MIGTLLIMFNILSKYNREIYKEECNNDITKYKYELTFRKNNITLVRWIKKLSDIGINEEVIEIVSISELMNRKLIDNYYICLN